MQVTLRVVTRPLASDDVAEQLCTELKLLISTLEAAGEPEVAVTERGSRRSIEFSLKGEPLVATLPALRTRAIPRV